MGKGDGSVRLRVSVEEQRQLDELWAKFESGKATLNEVAQAKRLLNKQLKDTPKGVEFDALATKMASFNERQKQVRLQTKAGHEEYFKAGLQLRDMALSGDLAKSSLGEFSSGLAASITNAMQMDRVMKSLGLNMGLWTIAAGIAISTTVGLVSYFSEKAEAAKKFAEELRKAKEELIDLDMEEKKIRSETAAIGTPREGKLDIKLAREKIEELLVRIQGLQAGRVVPKTEDLIQPGTWGKGLGVGTKELSDEEKKKNLEIDKEIKTFRNEVLTIEKDITAEKRRQKDLDDQMAARIRAASIVPRKLTFAEAMKPKPLEVSGFERIKGVPEEWSALTGTGKPGEGVLGRMLKDDFKEGDKASKLFAHNLANGLASATSGLADGFIKAFGLGDDLLSQFAGTLLATFAQAGIASLFGPAGMLFSFDQGGWLMEPVLGRGLRSGAVYSLAETHPEFVSSSGRGGGEGTMIVIPVQLGNETVETVVVDAYSRAVYHRRA